MSVALSQVTQEVLCRGNARTNEFDPAAVGAHPVEDTVEFLEANRMSTLAVPTVPCPFYLEIMTN